MKKAAIFLLAIVYVAITSGVVVNIHYCMGHIASIKYGAGKDDHCGKCGMPQKKECCHTEYKLIKPAQAHFISASHFNFNAPVATLPSYRCLSQACFYENLPYANRRYHSPPDPAMNSLRLHNCVFRI